MSGQDRANPFYFYEFAYRGIGGEYLWPKTTWIDDQVLVIAASLSMVMGLVFTRGFLQTRTLAPKMHRFLGVIRYVMLVLAALAAGFPWLQMPLSRRPKMPRSSAAAMNAAQ